MASTWLRNISTKSVKFLLVKNNNWCLFAADNFLKFSFCTAAKPYVFHPKTRTLENKDQVLFLTKCVVENEMPNSVQNISIDDDIRQDLIDSYKRSIIQTRLFNYHGERSTKSTCALPLMLNMLKAVWSKSERFPGLDDMSLCYKPHVSSVWKRHDDLVQVSGNLGLLLSSKKTLLPFASHADVQNTENYTLNGLDLIAPVFDMQQVASNALTDTGFYEDSPYPHAHTLIIVNTEKNWSVEERCAQGLMFSFGRLIAQAVNSHGYKIGDVLKQPLSVQCLISDGFRLSFICTQLNTLEFSSDEGIKNIAWIKPGVQMYDKVLYSEDEMLCEVEDFNHDCFELFTKMITNGLPHQQSISQQ